MVDRKDRNEGFVLAHLGELAQRAEELQLPVVLVHNGKVVDYFSSEIEAMKVGYKQFGRDPFYVRVVAGPDCLRVVASNFSHC